MVAMAFPPLLRMAWAAGGVRRRRGCVSATISMLSKLVVGPAFDDAPLPCSIADQGPEGLYSPCRVEECTGISSSCTMVVVYERRGAMDDDEKKR